MLAEGGAGCATGRFGDVLIVVPGAGRRCWVPVKPRGGGGPFPDVAGHIGKYKRSYGNDPLRVAQFAKIFVEEHRKKSIATALKHFPGHGYSPADTHHGIADTTQTADREMELTPYKKLITDHIDMIMTAHIVNKNYDPEGYPATLSPLILQKLLLGSNIMASWFLMTFKWELSQQYYKMDEAITLALNATSDFLVFSNNTSGTYSSALPMGDKHSSIRNDGFIVLWYIRKHRLIDIQVGPHEFMGRKG